MPHTWLSITVELVGGRGDALWPRPGRMFLVRPTFTFRQLAEAVNTAFGRWDLAHLHRFVLTDGTEVIPSAWWDDGPPDAVDDTITRLSRLEPGERFVYEFDLGDVWEHVCTVAPDPVDPEELFGEEPLQPTVYFGWGTLPDQHGREERDDPDGAEDDTGDA